jgi:hypothetical protein
MAVGRLPRRRRWGLVALGALLIVVSAVAVFLVVETAAVTRPYLAVTHPVPYGSVIEEDDLTVLNVASAAGLDPILAADRGTVVGRRAAVDLVPGTLLTRAQFTDALLPGAGQQLVGIELKPAQVPAHALKPGDRVALVIVPPTTVVGAPDSGPIAPPQSIPATVFGASPPAASGTVRVDVVVSQADGPTVATMAAAGRIAVVVTARG